MELWLILGAVGVLAVGLGAGYYIGRDTNAALKHSKELEDELQSVREDLADYRAHVTEHFSTTAKLVNDLTVNYLAVYKHLAQGAQGLTEGEAPKLVIDVPAAERLLADSTSAKAEIAAEKPPVAGAEVEPPKTAPKQPEAPVAAAQPKAQPAAAPQAAAAAKAEKTEKAETPKPQTTPAESEKVVELHGTAKKAEQPKASKIA